MNDYVLMREQSADDGTFGTLQTDDAVFCTAELPWRDNQRDISCIPEGAYCVIPYKSPKFGACFRLEAVEGRTDILMHPGNYAGDKAKGYQSDVQGCILIGEEIICVDRADSTGRLLTQRMVTNSRKAFEAFSAQVGRERFRLIVKGSSSREEGGVQ